MKTRRRAQRHGSSIVVLLLMSIFGCAIRDGAGPDFRLRNDGSIAGRVEHVGSGGSTRGQVGQVGFPSGSLLVYLEPSEDSLETPAAASEVEIKIGGGRQDPPLVVVPPDQPFHFLNLDPIHHEPFSLDAPNDFRVRMGGREASDPVRLAQNGFVRAFCRLHPAEAFVVIVSPARHVVPVHGDGSFEISNIRSGVYRIRAAGLDVESAAMPVRVSRGEVQKLALKLSPRSAR